MKSEIISNGHVGMLVHAYYPRDIRVRREAEALAEAGYQVDVVCLRESNQRGKKYEPLEEKVNGVHIHRMPFARSRGTIFRYFFEYLGLIILGTWKLIALHFKNSFQVIHIHNMPDFLILAGLIPKLMGAKLLLDVHDPMPELYASGYRFRQNHWIFKILKWQEKLSWRLAYRVISVNETMRENLEGKGIQQEKIFILHNFPDTRYLPIKNEIAIWPRHKAGFILLYAGTITKQYRLDVAVKALALASKHLPELKLRILGDGNDVDRVIQLAYDLGVEDRVEYLDPVNVDQLKDIMEDADVGISSNQGGQFGDLQFCAKILDYLTQGLPVVSSRTKTILRYIPENALFYFEPENAEDMAKQIIEIRKRPDLVRSKMEEARKLFPKYTWEIEKYKLIHFYQELVNEI